MNTYNYNDGNNIGDDVRYSQLQTLHFTDRALLVTMCMTTLVKQKFQLFEITK